MKKSSKTYVKILFFQISIKYGHMLEKHNFRQYSKKINEYQKSNLILNLRIKKKVNPKKGL